MVTEEIRNLQNTVGVEDVDVSHLHAYWNGALTIITTSSEIKGVEGERLYFFSWMNRKLLLITTYLR